MPNLLGGLVLFVLSLGLFTGVFYGGAKLVENNPYSAIPTEVPGAAGPTAEPGAPSIQNVTASNLQFSVRTITVARSGRITVHFMNKDSGVSHNMAFYTNKTAQTKIYVGAITTGISQADYEFAAPSNPGTYFFRCDVHPDTMTGNFIVQ